MPSFQLVGLDPAPFEGLFLLDDQALARLNARRVRADAAETYPCRVSLEEAQRGDEMLLLPFEHQPASSPYRASGPIFVRRGQAQRRLPPDTLTPYVTKRLMSVRAYGAEHMIVDATVCEGRDLAHDLRRLMAREDVAYLHLHNARRGCFSCRVDRA